MQAVPEALKVAHRLGGHHIRRQHPLHAALVAEHQRNAVGVRQAKAADGILHAVDAFHIPEGVQQPGQVDAKNFPHTAGAGVAHKEVLVVLPGVPIRQILPDVVHIMHRLAEPLHPLFDVLGLPPVQHGGGQKQRQALFLRQSDVFLIPVRHQIQLGEHRQAVLQKLGDDARVGQRRGADQRRIGGVGHGGGNGRLGGVHKAEVQRLGAAGLSGVHADDVKARVDAPAQPCPALAHGTETHNEKFHS